MPLIHSSLAMYLKTHVILVTLVDIQCVIKRDILKKIALVQAESIIDIYTTYIDRLILCLARHEKFDLWDPSAVSSRPKSSFNRNTMSFRTTTLVYSRDHRRSPKNLEIARVDRWSDRRTIRSIPLREGASSRPSSGERLTCEDRALDHARAFPARPACENIHASNDDENHPVLCTRGPTIARDARALAARELTATPGRVRGQAVRGSGWLSRVARKGWMYDGERRRDGAR